MKRKLFATSAVAIAALLVLGSGRLVSNRQVAENSLDENMFDMNVEALADGEDGTPVETCYARGAQFPAELVFQCDSRTTGSMLYPCPLTKEYIQTGMDSKCIK